MSSKLAGVQLHLVRTIDDAMEFKRWLGTVHANNAIGVDTETTGFDPYAPDAKVRLCQFGDTKTGWAVPWDDWRGVCLEALAAFEGDWVYHNVAFDAKWLEQHSPYRLPWHRTHDTMIQAHILDPTESVALKNLAVKLVDRRANAGEFLLKESMHRNKWTWATVPIDFDQYWAYGALDPVLTAILHDTFAIRSRYLDAYELELATRRITLQMEQNGAPIDVEYCHRKYKELNDYVESSKAWAKSELGFSIGSNVQLARHFTSVMGATITETTPTGSPSVNKDQLQKFIVVGGAVGSLAQFVLDVRKADKLAQTYFLNLINGNRGGVVHPSIRTLGARTSRMSITQPALQTLPKNEATVRDAFIPRGDEVIIASDLDQVEFRMFASLSQDPELIELFKRADDTGSDVFTELGREVYDDLTMTKADKRRRSVKGMIYGRLYGAGIHKQALTAGVPDEQMQAVADRFDMIYPGVRMFQSELENIVLDRLNTEGEAYIRLRSGRRVPVDRDRMYVGMNYTVQGGAAEVFKANLIKLDLAGLGDAMLVPVHDEIVCSVPREDVRECTKIIKECMTTTEGWAVPLTAGVTPPLERWGDAIRSAS